MTVETKTTITCDSCGFKVEADKEMLPKEWVLMSLERQSKKSYSTIIECFHICPKCKYCSIVLQGFIGRVFGL